MNYWIWLSSIEILGSIKAKNLLDKFKTPENVFNASKEELMDIDGIGEKSCENILNSKKNLNKIEQVEIYMKKEKIGFIKLGDENYPKNLTYIYDPPLVLFYKGNLELLNNKNIAIVGSRRPSEYGIRVAQKIGKDVSAKRN